VKMPLGGRRGLDLELELGEEEDNAGRREGAECC
jgi:hypothetical protein